MEPQPEPDVQRWRARVRAMLPAADPDVVEEIAYGVADRWARARSGGADVASADAQAEADLHAWRSRPAPRRVSPAASRWSGLGTDARDAARSLRLHPSFTVGALLLSAMAAAAVVSAFAVVYGILWRPLPYPSPERLAVVWQVRAGERTQISYPDFADVTSTEVFDARAAMSGGRSSLRVGNGIERVEAIGIEAAGLAMLGATPALGRLLTAGDGGQPVAMVSHQLWTTHLGSDPSIVGRLIWVSGRNFTVVGVLEPRFDFELPVPPAFKREADLWMVLDPAGPFIARRDVSTYEAVVRLAPGVELREAQASLDTIAQRLAAAHRATNEGRSFVVQPLKGEVVAAARRPMLLVALAGIVTLAVALANLAILALVRGSERQGELTIRDALGAGAFRLRRQLFVEHALVALAGVLLGTAAATRIVTALVQNAAAALPRPDAIRFDAPVWSAAAAVALLIALVLTAQPMRLRSVLLKTGARSAGASGRRSRRVMVAAEIALALTLTAGGALLALSLARLLATDPGFVATGGASARVSAYDTRYPSKDDTVRFFDEVIARLQGLPQVTVAGAGSSLSLSGQTSGTAVVAEGRPLQLGARPTAGWQFITPGYLDASGMRLRAGRDFSRADRDRRAHVTVINETLARTLFGTENPIGRRIGVGGAEGNGDWHEIIGVVADVRHQALDAPPTARVYDLFGQHWGRTLYVVARGSAADAEPLLGALRRTVAAIDPEAPLFEAATLGSLVDRSAAGRRLASTLAVGLALGGVLLALVGVYAVAAASVAERTKEIGVRAALGAAPRDLFALIAREGAATAVWGGGAGLLGAIAAVRLLDAHLFGVRPADAAWLVPLVTIAVFAAALLAAIPPSRRAANVDPLVAIKE